VGSDADGGVDNQDGDIRALEMTAGHDRAELFGDEFRLALAADAGGIEEAIGFAVAIDDSVHHVARGASLRGDDGAFAADELVEECGLANVGTADNSDIDVSAILGRLALGEIGSERIEELVDAETVFGGNGKYFVAQLVKRRGHRDLIRHVHFVDRDDWRLPGAAKQLSELRIEGHGAGAAVNDLDDAGGVANRDFCLAQNFGGDHRFVVGDDAACVHDFEQMPIPVAGAINAVTGDSRLIGDDGAARAGEAIEECGLADIGAACDYDGWKLFVHVDCIRESVRFAMRMSNGCGLRDGIDMIL